ncbi:MAG: RHS repeat domain-containing protein, partial [Intestinibacter bartlettii]
YYYDSNNHNQLMQTVYFEKGDNQLGKATLQTTYTYDLKENVTSMVDYKYDGNNAIPYHYTYYEYDLNGTMTGYAEINASSDPDEGVINNHKLVYNYDVEGNLSEIVYPTSLNDEITSIKFEYNEYNWITKIKAKINSVDKELRDYSYNTDGTINNIKDYTYDTNGNVNGYILKKYTYDNFGRVSSMKYYNSDSDTVKESYTYTYDKNSNIKSEYIINNYPTNGSNKVNQSREYTYDVMNRLTNSLIEDTDKNNPYSVYYTYDKVGNRLSMRDENTKTVTSYTYNDLNQLISSTESKLSNSEDIVSNKNYSYDGNGNNIKEVDSIKNITKEMTYDVDNRLDTYTETKNNETTTQNNLYNGNGQRIQKQEGNNTINYYYQGSNVLYTTNGEGDKTSHNFVGLEGNTISTMRYDLTGLEYYVYNKDIKGSTTNIIDNNKNAKISYKYSDFGETEEFGDTDFYNEIAYTGGIYDKSTSLYYLNARYYNPEDARFITQDTYRGEVNEPNTLHLYSYCANNPINYVDPTGHTLCVISHVITGSVIISMTATRSIVISSSGRIGVAKSASIGISIGPGLAKKVSANTGVQISLYGNTSRIGDLNGHSIDASMSASVGVYNAAVGTSISVKKKSSKGKVLPVVSVGVSAVASLDISANLNLTYSRVMAFPYNINYYKRHKQNTYTYYYFGEKQTITTYSKFIDVKYYGLKLRLYNEKKYNIK